MGEITRRIFYFTGTGNSMRAARIIAGALGDTEILSMRCDPKDVPATDCEVVGFVYPVYHWTMPAHAADFVQRLYINPNAYIFVVAMPSFICVIACERLAQILEGKGAHIHYGNLVHSVANYAIIYPPFPPAKLRVPRTEKKLARIAGEIASRTARPYPRAGRFIKWRREKVMTPYLELQKYADNPFTVNSSCVHCGLCSRVCPCASIHLVDGKPTFQHHCMNCMACVVSCPKRAIGYEITAGDRALLKAMTRKAPIVKLMGLPPGRKLYRNPYISVQDLAKDREWVAKNQGKKRENASRRMSTNLDRGNE